MDKEDSERMSEIKNNSSEEESLIESNNWKDEYVWHILHSPRYFLFYLASILYMGICFALLAFNTLIVRHQAENATTLEDEERAFHLVEFIAPLCYTPFILLVVYQPIKPGPLNAQSIYSYIEQATLYIQCLVEMIAALMVIFAQEDFETIAHYLDYTSLLCLSLVDLMLLIAVKDPRHWWIRLFSFIAVIIAIIGTIALYVVLNQGMDFISHFLEFSMEIILIIATVTAVSFY